MVIRPTLKYTSLGMPRIHTPASEPSTPSGTTNSTATGMLQLSYRADRHRKTANIEKANRMVACEPESFSSRDWPVHSKPKPGGSWPASFSISAIASPVEWPGATSPAIFIAG